MQRAQAIAQSLNEVERHVLRCAARRTDAFGRARVWVALLGLPVAYGFVARAGASLIRKGAISLLSKRITVLGQEVACRLPPSPNEEVAPSHNAGEGNG